MPGDPTMEKGRLLASCVTRLLGMRLVWRNTELFTQLKRFSSANNAERRLKGRALSALIFLFIRIQGLIRANFAGNVSTKRVTWKSTPIYIQVGFIFSQWNRTSKREQLTSKLCVVNNLTNRLDEVSAE